jgi:phage tail sheath gpL-like
MIPTTIRMPMMYAEFSNANATNNDTLSYDILLIGQKTSTGTVVAYRPYTITSLSQAGGLFGIDSQLYFLIKGYLQKANGSCKLTALPLPEPVGGTASFYKYLFAGTATEDGTYKLTIFDQYVGEIHVQAGDTAAAIRDRFVTQFSVKSNTLNWTFANEGEAVASITCKNLGILDKAYMILEGNIAGITVSIHGNGSGTGEPIYTNLFNYLEKNWHPIIGGVYTSAAFLQEMQECLEKKWGYLQMQDGIYFTGVNETFDTSIAFTTGKNYKFICYTNLRGVLSSPSKTIGTICAEVGNSVSSSPAIPIQHIALTNLKTIPTTTDTLLWEEQNNLLWNGISVLTFDRDIVNLKRLCTMYRYDELGAEDVSYLNIETMFTLMYIRTMFNRRIQSKYPRSILCDSADNIEAGISIMTPSIGKIEAQDFFLECERRGIVENGKKMGELIICKRNSTDRDRLDWVLPPDLANQFRIGTASIEFIL